MKAFDVLSAPRLAFGAGALSRIPDIAATLCVKGAALLLATDRNIAAAGHPALVAADLREHGFRVTIIDTIPAEPSDSDLEAFAGKVREAEASAIIAIGGGSVIDAAKILSVMALHDTPPERMAAEGVPGRGIPCIMVPTTAGTGAEATPNAIVLFPSRNLKIGIVSPFFIPDRVVLDPELLTALPPSLTASTGIDAVCHLLECLIGKKANAFSDMCAREGLRLMVEGLPQAFANGGDIGSRSKTMFGAYLGGVCIASSGTNIVHALSYPLGGTYRIPHGVANAILLVPCMEYLAAHAPAKLALAAGALGCATAGGMDSVAAGVVEKLRALVGGLRIPSDLKQFGVTPAALDGLAEAAHGVRRLLENSPAELGMQDIRAIYGKLV